MRLSLFALLAAGSLFAQRPTAGGFGSVMFPGTGGPPRSGPAPARVAPPPVANGGFRHSPPPTGARPQRPRPVIVPYPVYYGGYYGGYGYPGSGYAGGYAQPDPAAAYGQPTGDPYQGQPPAVIYNQDFRPDAVNPQMRDYSNVPLPPPGPRW